MMGDRVEELLAGPEYGVWSMENQLAAGPFSWSRQFVQGSRLQGAVSGSVIDRFVPSTRLTRLCLPQ